MIQDISRRAVLGVGGALLLPAGFARAQEGRVVETTEGRYRGLLVNGVHVFKGMRYGASTAGAGRFLPPKPPEKFTGVRDAFDYGDQTPQAPGGLAGSQPMSEDCLRINVWTPNPGDGKKRPVMLWFHGGGFEAGSGASPMYDGTNMVKRGDVVTCTINSRLNVFGFCDLSSFLGPEFAQSGNAGYLDLVRSMQWVRDNIAAFGGDPGNVMIYGQSGGGRKVTVCFAGKEAAGLFHKGVVQSGSHNVIQTKDQAAKLAADLMRRLEIDPKNARALQQVPQTRLSEVQRQAIAAAGHRFEPVMDGIAFTAHPFIPNAPAQTSKVPMMVGTAKTELSNQLGNDPAVHQIDEAGLRQRVAGILPAGDVDEAVRLFKSTTPSGSYPEMFFKIASWRSYIRNATIMAEKRDEMNGASNPTWMYQVTWRSPVEGGRRYSQHSSDLPFMFDNCDKPVAARYIGTQTADTKVMADSMANAWIAFARNGNPNHPGIPNWPAYNKATRSVMEFEAPPKLVNDPYKSERVFFERYQPSRTTSSD
jgi:para-nitrobenzyl esterase